ncbi:MAG: C45 family peptidase, partial [Solirubrobacteraceae bacterium]
MPGLAMTLYAIDEPQPGPRWQALFDATWSSYRRWYLRDGEMVRPSLSQARAELAAHMPELVPTWQRLQALTGGDEIAARMLALYNPPLNVAGCSQAVLRRDREPAVLVRNYDHDPALFERVVYRSAFTGRQVIGTGDCLWGLLDGMNDDGLAVSLTFGGRRVAGQGFGVQLIVRYLLETCKTVASAHRQLERLRVQSSYNLTMLDATGAAITVEIAPDRPPVLADGLLATNHQGVVDWPEYAVWTRTVERERRLHELLDEPGIEREGLVQAFLRPPLRQVGYQDGLGTLYTAVYRPADGAVEYRWPSSTWRQSFDDFRAGAHTVMLPTEAPGDSDAATPDMFCAGASPG